jgi:hypothetical protein
VSAVISAVYHDRIEVMADTAVISNETGDVQALYPKAHVVPGRPIVVAGLSNDARAFAHLVVDLMQVLASSSDVLVDLTSQLADKSFQQRHTTPNAVLVAGHFGGDGFRQHAFATVSGFGMEPFVLSDHQEVFTTGACNQEELAAAGADIDKLVAGLEPHGMRFMTAYRNKRAPNGCYGVGGQVQLATLRPTGVDVRTIGYWPDLIGKPITPGRQFVWAPAESKPVRAGLVAYTKKGRANEGTPFLLFGVED